MCRSIIDLRRRDEPAGRGEVEAAARQFVRRVSGFREPSVANREAFEAAIDAIADATDALLDTLVVGGRPVRGAPEAD
jgi:hypothetical protein